MPVREPVRYVSIDGSGDGLQENMWKGTMRVFALGEHDRRGGHMPTRPRGCMGTLKELYRRTEK